LVRKGKRSSSCSAEFEEKAASRHFGGVALLAGLPEAETLGGDAMAVTRKFRATLLERSQKDAGFRKAMLKEGIDTMLAGDVETGKSILRDYINAAVGFGRLAEATHIPAKSLMRMLGPKGNPRADNLFQIIKHLQAREGIHLEVAPG
jgi:DNA-binding phage protein